MSDLVGNHIVGFPTRLLIYICQNVVYTCLIKVFLRCRPFDNQYVEICVDKLTDCRTVGTGVRVTSGSPHFLFITMVIMIYLFVLDDSLTSRRFAEQLSKRCEQLQKLRVRLWPCKIDLGPPVVLCC